MQDPDGQPPAPHLTRLMADAWPAAEQVELGEWRLRWTGGFSRRANSAVATGHPGRDLGQAVDAVETFYAERGRPARLQVSGRASPPELGGLLRRRGYREDAPTEVWVGPLSGMRGLRGGGWDLEEAGAPDDTWWAVYAGVEHGWAAGSVGDAATEAAYRGTLLRPAAPTVFVTACRDGSKACVGQGVAQGEWLCVQCVATRPEHRRRGAARAVMAALGRWGERHGCRSAYLAVLRSNAPAQALHRGAGLTPVDAYAYLCAP